MRSVRHGRGQRRRSTLKLYTISWGVRHEPHGSYVIERDDDRPVVLYGPMPAALVNEFMTERQAAAREIIDRAITRLNMELPNAQDPPHQN